jgi:hypothetical protein
MARKYINPLFSGQANKQQPAAPSMGALNPLHALLQDPNAMAWASQGMYQPAANSLHWSTLRAMARTCQPVAATVLTRQDQVANFAKRPSYPGDCGFKIRMKDEEAKPSKAAIKAMRALEDIILRCGVGPNPGRARPGFDHYLRMLTRDGLTLDAMATELRPDRKGRLFDFWAIDGATIRHAAPSYEANQAAKTGYGNFAGIVGDGYGGVVVPSDAEIAFVQVVQGQPQAEFTQDELAYWIRNPRTDLEANGYGESELELLIEVITGYLNGMSYNTRYFTSGNIPEGVLSVVGKYSKDNLDAFIRYWNSMVQGVANAHRIPIMGMADGKGLDWTPIKANNREMQFSEWLDFLTTITCAIYRIDREELGFGNKAKGEAGGLGGDGNNDTTLTHSQIKGLRPLLMRIQNGINEDVIAKLPGAEDFEFVFTGIEPDQEDKKIDRAQKMIAAGLATPNEERAKFDMEAVPEDHLWGDAPGNATLYQAWSMWLQASTEAASGGDEGDPNADPDAEGDAAAPGQPGAAPKGAPGDEEEDDGGDRPAGPPKFPKIAEDGTESDDEEEDQ